MATDYEWDPIQLEEGRRRRKQPNLPKEKKTAVSFLKKTTNASSKPYIHPNTNYVPAGLPLSADRVHGRAQLWFVIPKYTIFTKL